MPKIIVPPTIHSDLEEKLVDWTIAKFGPDPAYSSSIQEEIDQWGLPWYRAGAIVVNDEGKILLMHEGRVQRKNIKDKDFREYLEQNNKFDKGGWADGDGKWNLPSGHLRSGESFEEGVLREVREESDWDIEVTDICHIRYGNKPTNLYALPVYAAKALDGPVQYSTRETLEIAWFSVEGIRALNTAGILRSPDFVMESLDAYEAYLRGEKKLNDWE